jgi:hypothetical protein
MEYGVDASCDSDPNLEGLVKELPVPKKDGYIFLGWWTVNGGANTNDAAWGESVTAGTRVRSGAHTLYARWIAGISFMVILERGDGTSTSFMREAGASYGGELVAPNRAGLVFAGWWTKDGGISGDDGDWGERVTSTDEVRNAHTLFARWAVPVQPAGISTTLMIILIAAGAAALILIIVLAVVLAKKAKKRKALQLELAGVHAQNAINNAFSKLSNTKTQMKTAKQYSGDTVLKTRAMESLQDTKEAVALAKTEVQKLMDAKGKR